ncbi:thioredoxin family protein [Aquimarina agarivorans]|uniref:thioredoxin family protein n=1 Tax=Aquimarina agarivorans TaxID=980584 RepID=UPI000248E643|nr:thioredoxin family protein [Aquimarina agarivorans]
METTTSATVEILNNSLANSLSYPEYREKVSSLIEQHKSTGNDPDNEALLEYSKLNDRRMKRLDKTIKIDASISEKIRNVASPIKWVVLTESWCGDAAQSLPVINKLAELNENIDFRVVLRDENDDLMNQFLTNGGKSIPKLIAFDAKKNEIINSWGPRPTKATQMVNDYKKAHGKLTPEFKQDLQIWYNKDKGANIAEDLSKLV